MQCYFAILVIQLKKAFVCYKDMNIAAEIQNILNHTALTYRQRMAALMRLREKAESHPAAMQPAAEIALFEAVRTVSGEAQSAHDVMVADVLLAEAYRNAGTSFLITPLVREITHIIDARVRAGREMPESDRRMYAEALHRLSKAYMHTGHPRRLMRLLAMELGYFGDVASEENAEEAAWILAKLARLTGDDRFIAPVQRIVDELLSREARLSIERYPALGYLQVDPVEYTQAWEDVIDSVELELYHKLKTLRPEAGRYYRYWREKAALLHSRHGISWKSPARMNPGSFGMTAEN